MHNLIIVEGLPCSGKSSTAKYIADRLNMLNIDEGSGMHPADYEFHAFIHRSEMQKFSYDDKKKIIENSNQKSEGFVVSLSAFQGTFFEKLLQYKIYDFLPWEVEKPVMLDKWREFVDNKNPDEKYVFNCVLLQNPMCETMMRFGFNLDKSSAYISEICNIIKPLNPVIVYLQNDNICESVKNVVSERGDEWLNAVIDYHCNGVYGKSKQLNGFDGYIAALEERQRRELEILSGLDIEYIVLNNPQKNWNIAYLELYKRLV